MYVMGKYYRNNYKLNPTKRRFFCEEESIISRSLLTEIEAWMFVELQAPLTSFSFLAVKPFFNGLKSQQMYMQTVGQLFLTGGT